MCQIKFKIQADFTVTSAKVRYREKGATAWSKGYNVNLSNPQTPNITKIGEYELQIQVNGGEWQGNYPFSVSSDCGGGTDTGGSGTDNGNNGGGNTTGNGGNPPKKDCKSCVKEAEKQDVLFSKRDGTIRAYLDGNCTIKCPMTSKLGKSERVDLGYTWYDVAIYDVTNKPNLVGQTDTLVITVCGESVTKTFVIPNLS